MVNLQALGSLPRWALVAFAARCARRVAPLYSAWATRRSDPDGWTAVDEAIRVAELSASCGSFIPPGELRTAALSSALDVAVQERATRGDVNTETLLRICDALPGGRLAPLQAALGITVREEPPQLTSAWLSLVRSRGAPWGANKASVSARESGCPTASSAAQAAAHAAAAAAAAHARDSSRELAETVKECAGHSLKAVSDTASSHHVDVERDLTLLAHLAEHADWRDTTRVSPAVFGLHTNFAYEAATDSRSVQLCSAFSKDVMARVQRKPTLVYEMTGREFELFIAKIWDKLGYRVRMTPVSRDGGHDLLCVDDKFGRDTILIECKRYSPERRIHVGLVRQLAGTVVDVSRPSNTVIRPVVGILATTSWFTGPALDYVARNPFYFADAADFVRIVQWLDMYHSSRMLNAMEPYRRLILNTRHIGPAP